MLTHDTPVSYLGFSSRRPDIVVKLLKADAYRALADQMLTSAKMPLDKDATLRVRKYTLLAELYREAAAFDANEANV
ncbi:hypothetical protein LJR234_005067 [Mesorhizobium amorphae]|uniref:hypothetical protein n=1 Tax=Mesorhizobium amorphae TaxID=71433 RepID=UPI003ECCC09B